MVAAKSRPTPKIGRVFERTYKGTLHRMRVVDNAGTVSYELNGRCFKTPTAAARSITNTEVNGWIFWHIDKPIKNSLT